MDTPFPYSQYVTGKHFIGRKNDVNLLGNLLSQGEHVCIYEPPKTGITSLVQQTLFNMRLSGKSFSVGQFSVLNIRTPEVFLLRMGSTLLKMVASTADEYAALVKRYLPDTHFVFDARAFAENNQVLSLSWNLDRNDITALLNFPFRLAADRGERLILIFDEFQCAGLMEDPDLLLRPLEAVLRENRDKRLFSCVFCGSGVNAMKAIFASGLRFHRVVERVCLSPVNEGEIVEHVQKGFLAGGKVVNQDLIMGACRLFRGNLWYINHFSAICDAMSRGYIMEPVFVDALEDLISIHKPHFAQIVSGLTTHQVNLLKATVDGVTRFSSSEVVRNYCLNSSANVKRVKDALMKKEVLAFDDNDAPVFQDPLFEYWIKKYYFETQA